MELTIMGRPPAPYIRCATTGREVNPDYAREFYLSGMSQQAIADQAGTYLRKIQMLLDNTDVKSRPRSVRKHEVNDRYFKNIDTPAKAYWLGFLTGDGYLTIKKHSGTHQIGMYLQIGDKKHIEKFLLAVEANYVVGETDTVSGKFAQVAISSKEMFEDLSRCGLTIKKSAIVEPFYSLRKKFLRHYLRGLVDANGCLYEKSDETKQTIRLVGTSSICRFFADSLYSSFGYEYSVRKADRTAKTKSDFLHQLTVEHWQRIAIILDWLYKDCGTDRLDRKYEKACQMAGRTI